MPGAAGGGLHPAGSVRAITFPVHSPLCPWSLPSAGFPRGSAPGLIPALLHATATSVVAPPVEVVDALTPASNWPALVEWTTQQDAARVAWVGHMPCVGRLVGLTIGDGSASIRMQKGAAASIRLDDGPGHPGELEWLATDDIV